MVRTCRDSAVVGCERDENAFGSFSIEVHCCIVTCFESFQMRTLYIYMLVFYSVYFGFSLPKSVGFFILLEINLY